MIALLLLGCSGLMDATNTEDTGSATEDQADGTLRVDITPLSSSGLLPQSTILLPGQYQSAVAINLAPTITREGYLTGMVTHPWGGAPAQEEPLEAVITAALANSVAYGATTTILDDGARFSISLPLQVGYTFAVVPADASTAPVKLTLEDFLESSEQDIQLPVGIPIYGRLTDEDGRPLVGAPLKLHAVGTPVPISSSIFYTDANGWYLVRIADPGTWRVTTVAGPVSGDGYLMPAVESEVLVENEAGARADLSIGAPTPSKLIGKVVDATGVPVAQARVRLTSTVLNNSAGRFSAEVDTSRDGTFYAEALAGSYELEIIPPYGNLQTPVKMVEEVGASVADVGTVALASGNTLDGVVLGGTEPLVGTVVTATQREFGGYVYTTTTGEGGKYHLDVPAGDYSLVLTPPDPNSWAITRALQTTGTSPIFTLDSGVQLDGAVRFDDAPVGSALVEVHAAASNALLARTLTDKEGAFSVRVQLPTPGERGDDSGDTGTQTDTGGTDTGATDTGGTDTGVTDTGGTDTGA